MIILKYGPNREPVKALGSERFMAAWLDSWRTRALLRLVRQACFYT